MHNKNKEIGFLELYILFWFSWLFWCQTVGRITFGLSVYSGLIFDIAFILAIKNIFILKIKLPNISKFQFDAFSKYFVLGLIALVIMTSLIQVPFDWDGTDYHLPPLIEMWKDGYWHHSQNPYFAARNYPKTAMMPQLWWVVHFGKILGLRGILTMSFLHWFAGLIATLAIFGNKKWIALFWLAIPLVYKQATTGYADLAGLSALIIFIYFLNEKKYIWSAIAFALFGAIKFTNLASAVAILSGLFVLRYIPFQKLVLIGLLFLLTAALQPVENYLHEGKLFGPLQCKILGTDFCNGTLDPSSLIVEPVLPYKNSDNFIQKVIQGWTPNQIVLNADAPNGGFGWAFILPIIIGLFSFFRKKHYKLIDAKYALVFLIVVFAEVPVPGLWYCRYHLPLGWALGMLSALILENLSNKKIVFSITLLLFLQFIWIAPQRIWFLGMHKTSDTSIFIDNIKSYFINGFSSEANHSADQRSIKLYKIKNSTIQICGDLLRPVLAAYGADLSNTVEWVKASTCLEKNDPPFETILNEQQITRYWVRKNE